MFRRSYENGFLYIVALNEVIAGAAICHPRDTVRARLLQCEYLKFFSKRFASAIGRECFCNYCEFLGSFLFIEYAVFAVVQIHAADAVFAADAMQQEIAVATVFAAAAALQFVASQAIQALRTALAFNRPRAIQAVATELEVVRHHAILGIGNVEAQIAFFAFVGIVRVIAVLHAGVI